MIPHANGYEIKTADTIKSVPDLDAIITNIHNMYEILNNHRHQICAINDRLYGPRPEKDPGEKQNPAISSGAIPIIKSALKQCNDQLILIAQEITLLDSVV